MRKMNRVAKRTMALILSLSMVLGLSFTVYADEEPTEATATEAAVETRTTESAPAQAPAPTVSQAQETAGVADQLIGQASEETVKIAELTITDPTIAADLGLADGYVDNVSTALGNADTAMGAALDAINGNEDEEGMAGLTNDLDTLLNDKETGLEKKLDAYDTADSATTGKANTTIDYAKTANESNIEKEATTAAANAVKELAATELSLVEAQNAYTAAQKAASDAQAKYDDAYAKQQEALDQVEIARGQLEEAQTNATAALERLKAAQANANLLAQKVETYAENKEQLTAIEKQYHAMMVRYYRDLGCAVYDDDGILNVAKSAAKATEEGLVDGKSVNPGNPVMQMSRELMEEIVKYMISTNEGIDAGTIKFAVQQDGLTKKTASDGKSFMAYDEDLEKTVEDSKITANHNQWWTNVTGDNGRNNHVEVSYIDKNGKPQTVYFNYIFKNSGTYHDDVNGDYDIENGPIYLALIENKDGKWTNSANHDENNFDDYGKLTNAIQAIEDIKKYQALKDAVDAAEKKVEELKSQVEKLENVSVDTSKLDELKKQLDDAQADLKTATQNKAAMEQKVQEARDAVAAIDLSRFRVKTSDEDPAGPVTPATPDRPEVVVTPVIPEIVPVVTIGSTPTLATLAAVAPDAVELIEDALPAAEIPAITLEDEELPAAAQPVSMLEENELPAAQTIEESMNLWWLWLLLLLIALIVAYMVYRYNEKKKEEKAA
ncbi:MAG: hypothetical protein J5518_06270 [Lachnospiraceae bacterium]|nr:hypothetical protein [Lachnospiraceae bacterium]